MIGIYDHKLGPICACPKIRCEWLKNELDSRSIIQDGLNTKSGIYSLKNAGYIIQAHKFSLTNPTIRGQTLRCCLFVFVPVVKPLIPMEDIEMIIKDAIRIADAHNTQVDTEECEKKMLEWEDKINQRLEGTIGIAQLEHKARDLLNTIIGYSEIMADEIPGPMNGEQKENMTYIWKFANELLNLFPQFLSKGE